MLDYSSDDALKILGKYSEQTFDKVMKTVHYLEYRTKSTLKLIKCAKGKMTSIFLELPSQSELNFLDVNSIQNLNSFNRFQFSQTNTKYTLSREKDIFNLIESGYKVVNEKMYNHLADLRKTQLN